MFKRLSNALLAAAASIVVLACAIPATTLDAQWVNPDDAGRKAVRNVLVMGAVRDATNRRLFEDRMVASLTAAGVKAVQSYKFIPEAGPVSEERLRRAVAEGVLDGGRPEVPGGAGVGAGFTVITTRCGRRQLRRK